jgi:hypothetical protein
MLLRMLPPSSSTVWAKVLISAKNDVVRSDGGEHAGVVEGSSEGLFQFAHPGQNGRVDERVEALEVLNLFAQGFEFAQELDVLFGQERSIGVRQDFDECDLKR